MSLVGTLTEISKGTSEELNRYTPNRPIIVDGSLSEMVSQALNLAFSKKNMTTGEPNYGHQNANGDAPPGAGGIPNITTPDSPMEGVVKPSMEAMQQMQQSETAALATVLEDAIDAHNRDGVEVDGKPLMIYALPTNNNISEEMNADLDMYIDSGAINPSDFIFIYTDEGDPAVSAERVVPAAAKIKDYEQRGASIYPDLQSFMAALPDLRRR